MSLHTAIRNSTAGRLLRRVRERLGAVTAGSGIRRLVVGDGGGDASGVGDGSGGGIAGATRRLVTGSWLYRWLTAEPEPDVIVIDLRETWTVGPILAVIERCLGWLGQGLESSRMAAIARHIHRRTVERPVQVASLAVGLVALALLGTAATGTPSTVLVATSVALAVLAAVGSRITWTWAELQKTRGYQILAAAFAPPEPPDSEGER